MLTEEELRTVIFIKCVEVRKLYRDIVFYNCACYCNTQAKILKGCLIAMTWQKLSRNLWDAHDPMPCTFTVHSLSYNSRIISYVFKKIYTKYSVLYVRKFRCDSLSATEVN